MNHEAFRIIIIDDNHDIHRDFIKILTISNTAAQITELDEALFGEINDPSVNTIPEYIIDTASQGEEGVAKIQKELEEGHPFVLAFVDIRMPPGMDGIETIKQIWEVDQDIQVVICTAYSDYSWEDTVKTLGLTENLLILKKPFDVIAVRQLATALTQKWLSTRDTKKHTSTLNKLLTDHSESLDHSLALLRATIDSSFDGVLVIDLNGKIIDCNKQFLNFMGVMPSFLKTNDEQQLFQFILGQIEEPKIFKRILTFLSKKIDRSGKQIIKLKNQQVFECYSKPHQVKSKIVGRVWSFHDITEQIRLKEKLEYQATHDILTGLPNRSLLHDRLGQEIARCARNSTHFAIFFLDVDRFKFVNDSLSHDIGDKLLCVIATRLSGLLRKIDTIARLGGDEFILVFSAIKDEAHVTTIGHKILKVFNKPFLVADNKIIINVSIGISVYPQNGKQRNALLSNADLAMYQAKSQGGNQCAFFTDELNRKSEHFFQMEAELQLAVVRNEFFLVYQPQFDINSHKIITIEALLRWQHPKKGVVLPLEFVPIAESTGLIIPIGEWVIESACKQLNEWHQQGLPQMNIAVNVATKQLRQPHFSDTVAEILKKINLDVRFLEIEITENVIIGKEIQQTILKLKKLGCSIILDDFGTGNSSLNTLKELHIDGLKIDRNFVKNISKSRGDEAIVEAIIAISHTMHFKVVAEGVETETQIDFLRSKNCDEIQGYLCSKPLTAAEFEQFIKVYSNEKRN